MDAIAIVLGAGRGARLGAGVPKAQVSLLGRTLLHWSALALARARGVGAVLPVVAPGGESDAAGMRAGWPERARLLDPVPGGDSRQESLAAGLAALAPAQPDWVLVHDAARCLVLPEDAEAVLTAARETGAALPVVPVEDTIKELDADGRRVAATPERARLARAQTPQGFRFSLLVEAVEKARRDGYEGTDCSSLVERLGVSVAAAPGRVDNFKVTTPADMERAQALLARRSRA